MSSGYGLGSGCVFTFSYLNSFKRYSECISPYGNGSPFLGLVHYHPPGSYFIPQNFRVSKFIFISLHFDSLSFMPSRQCDFSFRFFVRVLSGSSREFHRLNIDTSFLRCLRTNLLVLDTRCLALDLGLVLEALLVRFSYGCPCL